MKNRRERSKITLSVLLALVLTALPTLAWADEGDDGHIHTEDSGDVPADEIEEDISEVPKSESVTENEVDVFEIGDVSLMASNSQTCGLQHCTCTSCGFYYYNYIADNETYHAADVHCDSCSASLGIYTRTGRHTFSGNTCTLCGYTKSCSHSSTSRSWVTHCDWEDVCNSCGETVGTGTTHGPYSYGNWSYYSSSQHRRTARCYYGDWNGYEYASHSAAVSYGQYNSTQHSVTSYCSECGSYIGSTSYSSHSFSYGSWTSYSSTQHQRSKTCSTCGYSEYEYESHSLSYGSWTQHNATQHKRTKSCSCGYSGTEYAAHTMVPGRWASVSDTQHSRTNVCECGHTATETASHADSDGDGNCDSCQYLMTRFSVTVPTSLSLGMSQTGQIYAATTAQIVNNSTGAVTVTGVKFTTANGWTLVPYTTNMADAKVNSKRIGFTVNGAASTVTGSTEAKTTAWQIAKGASLPLDYAAVVSATSKAVNEQVLTVVFVVGWAS